MIFSGLWAFQEAGRLARVDLTLRIREAITQDLKQNYYENNSLRTIFFVILRRICTLKMDIFKELRVRFVIFAKITILEYIRNFEANLYPQNLREKKDFFKELRVRFVIFKNDYNFS